MADPGEGPGGRPALFPDETEAQRAEKCFLETSPPPYLRVWMTAPLSQGLDPPLYLGSFPYKEDYQVSRISHKGFQGHLPSPLAKFPSVPTLKIFRVVSSNELHARIARPLSTF